MSRVKRGKSHLKRRKKLLKLTKGYKWGRKSKIKLAKTAAVKAGVYAYVGRRLKKRQFRRVWQIRINGALREKGLSYSKFAGALKKANIQLNRKILSELAVNYPKIFEKIIEAVKQ